MAQSFHHEPLPRVESSIRLLDLAPGQHDEPISCHLLPFELDSVRPYEALSYVWGLRKPEPPILCNGLEFKVTPGLQEVLRRLRYTSSKRTLWIDAICIDQSNDNEKQHQVALMRTIYYKAARVLVWLGVADEYTTMALAAIDDIAGSALKNMHRIELGTSTVPQSSTGISREQDELETLVKNVGLKVPGESYKALAALFDRRWFERIWVVQEVGNARNALVLIGKEERSWKSISFAAAWAVNNRNTLRHSTTPGPSNAKFMCKQDFEVNLAVPHLSVLQSSRHFQATDPRDKVYAMLNQSFNMRDDHYDAYEYTSQPFNSLTRHLAFLWTALCIFKIVAWVDKPVDASSGLGIVVVVAVFYFSQRLAFHVVEIYEPWRRPKSINSSSLELGEHGSGWLANFQSFLEWYTQRTWRKTTPSTLMNIKADYSVNSIEKVNRLVVLNTARRFKNLEFLSYVHHDEEELDESIPSWIPRWEQHTSGKAILASFTTLPYGAGYPELSFPMYHNEFNITIEQDWLRIEGFQIGAVTEVSDIMAASNLDNPKPAIVQQIFAKHGRKNDIYSPTNEIADVACILTLTASQNTPTSRTDFSQEAVHARIESATGHMGYSGYTDSWRESFALRSPTNNEIARKVCHMRRHFVTSSGYMGLGPAQVREGDIVFVLLGASCPFALRAEGKDVYRLVGECYVHGFMDGEAFELSKEGRLVREEVSIW